MITSAARPHSEGIAGPLLLLTGLGAASLLRGASAGGATATSIPAGLGFAGALLALAVAWGWRPGRPTLVGIGLGALGAAVLIAAPIARGGVPRLIAPPLPVLTIWAPAVCLVAIAEEVLIRGALYAAVEAAGGAMAALIVTSTVFAVIHLPLYGLPALPLDLAVGIWLGVLRRISGGVAAPAIAHTLADLAGAWLA